MKHSNLSSLFQKLGLSSREARVYDVLLQIKRGVVSKIAENARVNRTTAYDTLEFLYKKGLVLKYVENKKVGFIIDTPKRWFEMLTQKQRTLDTQKEVLNTSFQKIEETFRSSAASPKIRYFEGNEQIETFFQDSLDLRPDEILGYSATQNVVTKFRHQYRKWYSNQRAKLGIRGRYISPYQECDATIAYLRKYYLPIIRKHPSFNECRLLASSQKSSFLSETIVYADRIAVSHTSEQFFGVIIESHDIAETQRTVFNNLWVTLRDEVGYDPKTKTVRHWIR